MNDRLFEQKDDMVVGRSLSPSGSNILMEHFEILALDSAKHTPSLWLRNVACTFGDWPHVPEWL
jgi:hypothetical protein